MRIYDVNLTGAAAAESGRTQETQRSDRAGSKPGDGPRGPAGDRVEFSNGLGRLSQILSTHDAQRASRVQAMTAQYQGGTYRPDSLAASKGMVAEALAGH